MLATTTIASIRITSLNLRALKILQTTACNKASLNVKSASNVRTAKKQEILETKSITNGAKTLNYATTATKRETKGCTALPVISFGEKNAK